MKRTVALALATLCIGAFGISDAAAKRARCFTTDDGFFDCNFQAVDSGGSFTITARGKPGYTIYVDGPGTAIGYLETGGRSIALPGGFVRRKDDPACWTNMDTKVNVCAW